MKISIFLLLCFVSAGVFATSARAAEPFAQWLEGVKQEALAKGISQETVFGALNGITPIQRVIDLDRRQPEGKFTFAQYKKRVINDRRIREGRRLLVKHRGILEEISAKYGVEPQYIVALWGIETSYGENTGGFSVVSALATLAHDGRRSDFFRGELFNALRILDEGHISPHNMKGSWAGAMGQNQFMPSSFFNFAVDNDGDGRRDIWTTYKDIFASTANYLSRSGWKYGFRWGRPVRVPSNITKDMMGLDVKKPLSEWKRLGLKTASGRPIPVVQGMTASIVAPDGLNGEVFLIYENFRTILKWNRSSYFAASVGTLADAIAGAR